MMSYMNDDTDPFGVPYTSVKCPNFKSKEIKEYSFEDLENLHEKQRKIENELIEIKTEKKEAIEYLTEKLEKYVDAFAKIEIDDKPQFLKCNIITKRFKLNQLERIKEDFNLKNIEVEIGAYKIDEEYQKRIIISLEW